MSTIEQIGAFDAGRPVEDDLIPIGRAYYAFSTLLSTPASLSQEEGLADDAHAVGDHGNAPPARR